MSLAHASPQYPHLLIGHLDTVVAKQLESSIQPVPVLAVLLLLLFPIDVMFEVFLWNIRVYVL
jgi:hypothetical protein